MNFLALWQQPISAWGVADFLVLVVLIAAVVGITYVALRYFGVTIPAEIAHIIWIVIVAAVAIIAIRFLFSL